MKLHWLLPSTMGTILILSSPAMAAKLESWRFDQNLNRLEINTSGNVQPQAQLIFNPTRLVIDLPSTRFDRSQLTQSVGGAIRVLRIGQFDEQTTRIVVELNPGYTLDPKLIKFISTTGSRWIVQLPKPVAQAVGTNPDNAERPRQLPPKTNLPTTSTSILPPTGIYNQATTDINNPPNRSTVVNRTAGLTQIDNLRITGDGFFVRTSGGNPQVQLYHSNDRRTINIDIANAALSPNLRSRDLLINRYGVRRIQFSQLQTRPLAVRMTLWLDNNSSNWQVNSSNVGGFVILPNQVVTIPGDNSTSSTVPTNNSPATNSPATIQAVELGGNGTQLLIRANQTLTGRGSWDRSTGLFRITINNAKLAARVTGL